MYPRLNYPIQGQASDMLDRSDLLVRQKPGPAVTFESIEPARAGTPEEIGSVQAARVQVKRLLAEGTPLNTMCASLGSLAKLLRRLEDLGPEWRDEPEPAPALADQVHDSVIVEAPVEGLAEPPLAVPFEILKLTADGPLVGDVQRLYTPADQPPLMQSLLRARQESQE